MKNPLKFKYCIVLQIFFIICLSLISPVIAYLSYSFPATLDINYNDTLSVKYEVHQSLNRHIDPNIHTNTTHELKYVISFDNTDIWNVSATYKLNYINPITMEIIYYESIFQYHFYNDSLNIFKTEQNMNGINLTNTLTLLFNNDATVYNNRSVRTDSFLYILGSSYGKYNISIEYIKDQNIAILNNEYQTKIYQGKQEYMNIFCS